MVDDRLLVVGPPALAAGFLSPDPFDLRSGVVPSILGGYTFTSLSNLSRKIIYTTDEKITGAGL